MKRFQNSLLISLLTVLFTLLLSVPALAQKVMPFNHITHEQGLSQSTVNDILQDNQGFLWFGTNDGLNRYDGHEITVFKHDPDDSTSISYNHISVIFEDSNNNLWVGTQGKGLNLFDRNTNAFKRFQSDMLDYQSSISDNTVTDILEDREGKIWIGTYQGVNWYYPEKDEWVHFNSDTIYEDSTNVNSLSHNQVNALAKGSDGHIWVGTENGLNRWNPDTGDYTRFMGDPSDPYSISGNDIQALHVDEEGILWIGTATAGLNYYNAKTGKFHHYKHDKNSPNSISGNSIYSILEDSNGILWVGTESYGLNKFDREKGEFYDYQQDVSDPNSISNNAIYTIYESREQILWIGTFTGGVNYHDLKDPKFEHYRHNPLYENQLSENSVLSFLEDSHGNFWVGTDGGGLNLFDIERSIFHPMHHQPGNTNSLSSNAILELFEDSNQKIWIGYYNGGASRFNPETEKFRHYRHEEGNPQSLGSQHVYVIHEDKDNNIWFGTNDNGLSRLNPRTNRFDHFLPRLVVRDIEDAKNGKIWIGAHGGGLTLLDPGTGETKNYIPQTSELPTHVVMTIHKTNDETLWLGTFAGLIRFDVETESIQIYDTKDGLANNSIQGFLEDEQGNFWISTNGGISKFNPETESFSNYGVEDGLQSTDFNKLAYYKDSENYLYFGGINGFNRFHPKNVRADSTVPAIRFTDFRIFNRDVSIGENSPLKKDISQASQIVLPYDASVITIKYAALNFHHTKANKYAYKLEGFDNEWNYVGSKRTATYTNLDPGEYTLKVKASNSDDVWNEGTELAMVITPPFWQTYWFYALSVLFIAGVVYSSYQWKVRNIRELNEKLERKVDERTSALNEKNKDLEDALQELKKTRNELVEKAHKAGMADIATGVLHNVGNILNSVNTSATLIQDTVRQSKIKGFTQANQLLRQNIDRIEEFITESSKGKQLLNYYLRLEDPIKKEHQKVLKQSQRLTEKVELIGEAIAAQQSYAGAGIEADEASLDEMVNDALTLQSGTIERHGLTIKKDLQPIDPISAQRTQLIHILVNLFKNAKEAMAENAPEEKIINIKTWQQEGAIYLSISDNGYGIKEENIDKVFSQGFSTKNDGHGFGLHSCANYMQSMGGQIKVESEGEGKGATFTLIFPANKPNGGTKEKVKADLIKS